MNKVQVYVCEIAEKSGAKAEPGKPRARQHNVLGMRCNEGKISIKAFCRGLLSREIFILYVIFGSSELAENAL